MMKKGNEKWIKECLNNNNKRVYLMIEEYLLITKRLICNNKPTDEV